MTTISAKDRADAQAMAEMLAGCPLAALNNRGVRRWLAVRDCALASHTCQPEWRPTTIEEIQPGWEVRSRRSDGAPMAWGIAYRRTAGGNWRTEIGAPLTNESWGWTYETTAPEPAPDPRIQVVIDWANKPASTRHEDAIELLALLDLLALRQKIMEEK